MAASFKTTIGLWIPQDNDLTLTKYIQLQPSPPPPPQISTYNVNGLAYFSGDIAVSDNLGNSITFAFVVGIFAMNSTASTNVKFIPITNNLNIPNWNNSESAYQQFITFYPTNELKQQRLGQQSLMQRFGASSGSSCPPHCY